jgi:hypothetical protein
MSNTDVSSPSSGKARDAYILISVFSLMVALPRMAEAEWKPTCVDLVRAVAQPNPEVAVQPITNFLSHYVAQHYGREVTFFPLIAMGIGQGVHEFCFAPNHAPYPIDRVVDILMDTNFFSQLPPSYRHH